MPSIHLSGCSFGHAAGLPVFEGVDLDLGPGWVGVVGPNGAGKSTLLGIVAGAIAPTAGTCHVVSDVPPVLCAQEVGQLDDGVRQFAWDWAGVPARLRSRLGLDPDDLERWPTMSPGERKRWQVGAALASEPDVLLLDEPTNHLDAQARGLLLEVLRGFTGLGIVVSHDRALLEALTTQTLQVGGGTVVAHAGSHGQAHARWTADEAADRDAHARARREERRLRRALGEVRRERSGAEHAPRAARRANPDEPDAREAGRKFAAQKAEKKLANRVGQLHARVDRAVAEVDAITVVRRPGGDVTIPTSDSGRRWVARHRGDVRHAGGAVLLRGVDVGVGRGDHVRVAGPNGAGKTSLLGALVASAPGRTGTLPQELTEDEAGQVLARVRALDPQRRGRALGVVANLGVDPDRVLVTDRPSPGEARKLALALLLLEPADLVVLDEPTNHLDLPAIERLEQAVAAHAGALVVVTHDEAFAAGTTSQTWRVGDGRVQVES